MEETTAHRPSRAAFTAEVLLAVAIIFAPLAIGTIYWWSRAILVALCLGAGIAASWARPRPIPWPVWVAVGGAALAALQALPLPAPLYRALSPRLAEQLEFVGLGWHSLSFDPAASLRETALLTAWAAALFAASRVATHSRAARRLLHLIGAMAIVECIIVAAHLAVGEQEKIYGWVTLTVGRTLFGSIGNQNHMTGYLTLCVPLLAALALRARELPHRLIFWTLALAPTAFVGAAGSRTGLFGLLAALLALALLAPSSGSRSSRWGRISAIVGLVTAIFTAAAFLKGDQLDRLKMLLHPRTLLQYEKVAGWRDAPALIRDYWLTGVGRGAFEQIFPTYKHWPQRITFTHLESGPLQLWADFGLLGGTAILGAWLIGLVAASRRIEGSVLRAGVVAALWGITVHELSDYSLEASGAVCVTTAVLWGLVTRMHRGQQGERRWPRRAALLLGSALASLAFAAGWRGDLQRDLAAVNARLAAETPLDEIVESAMHRHPVEPWFPLALGSDLVRRHQPALALRYFNRTQLLDPSNWQAHQMTAEALWQLRRPSQAILELRLAYLGSHYEESLVEGLLARGGSYERTIAAFAGDHLELLRHLVSYLARHGRDLDGLLGGWHLLDLSPADEEAHGALAQIYARRTALPQALVQFEQLPRETTEQALLHARVLDQLNRSGEADALLERQLRNRLEPNLLLTLAERARDRQQPDLMMARLDTLETLSGRLLAVQLGRLHLLRGQALEAKGNAKTALKEFTEAARLDNSEANNLALGAAYERAELLHAAMLVYRRMGRSKTPSAEALVRLARTEKKLNAETAVIGEGGSGGGYEFDVTTLENRRKRAKEGLDPSDDTEENPEEDDSPVNDTWSPDDFLIGKPPQGGHAPSKPPN